MKIVAPLVLLVGASIWCVSCRPGPVGQSDSLVGADSLPAEGELALETITIVRGHGPAGKSFLSYELRPDGRLAVTLIERRDDKVLAAQTFHLAPGVANGVRRLLRRVRPARLEGLDAQEARPSGCRRRGPHDWGEYWIAFMDEQRRTEDGDHRIGVFELPSPDSCATPQAVEARRVVAQVLGSFPTSSATRGFQP